MTTPNIDLTQTDHISYEHDGQRYIDQDTFDLAIEHWLIDLGRDRADIATIYDGSSDVVGAYAWLNEEGKVQVAIVEFVEDADGYPIDSLPFTLDIAAAEPPKPAPTVGPQHFAVDIVDAPREITPSQLRAGIQSSMLLDYTDALILIRKDT